MCPNSRNELLGWLVNRAMKLCEDVKGEDLDTSRVWAPARTVSGAG